MRTAAYYVVRWCVILAIAKDSVDHDPELRIVGWRLTTLMRSGAGVADMLSMEQLQVYLINRLHDKVYELVDNLLYRQ